MKSICVALVSLTILCPLVVYAKPTELAEPSLEHYDELGQRSLVLESCSETLRDDLRPVAEGVGGWVLEVFNRILRITELGRSCRDMEMSDPPTRWEELQLDLCNVRFQGAIVVEVTRLTYEIAMIIQTYPPIVRESIEQYLDCARGQIPDFDEFHQMVASLHRS